MCIIAAKPAGIKMPSIAQQKIMWDNNSDGAGIMYAKDGFVHIQKGFMDWARYEAFMEHLMQTEDLDSLSVVMHFRIKTHGEINAENCHPFPVTRSIEQMKKTKSTCKLGMAHNGIINIVPRKGISDTMEYNATQLAPLYSAMPQFYRNASAMELVENAIDSKMALLNGAGELFLIGTFTESEGVKYSNYGYQKRAWTSYSSYNYGSGWDYDAKDAEYGFTRIYKKLMWCNELPEGSFYADLESGEMYDDLDDIAIDKEGNSYIYDYEFDGFEYLGMPVYIDTGRAAKWDEKKAVYEAVIDW